MEERIVAIGLMVTYVLLIKNIEGDIGGSANFSFSKFYRETNNMPPFQ